MTDANAKIISAIIGAVASLLVAFITVYQPLKTQFTTLRDTVDGKVPEPDAKGYAISSADELYNNIMMNMAGSFYLCNDIDIAADEGWNDTWTPLGWQNNGSHIAFTGTLDGQGHTIRGLKNTNNSMGLFETLSGTIKNLHVDVNFSAGSGGAFAVSMTNGGRIESCEASGIIQTNNGIIGGFVGTADKGIIKDCLSTVSLNAPLGFKGGIIGTATGSSVTHCFFKGQLSSPKTSQSNPTFSYTTDTVMISRPSNCAIEGCHYYCNENFNSEIKPQLRLKGTYKGRGNDTDWNWEIWKIDENKELNDGFPYLRIFEPEYLTAPE